jgi:hypothetical protein
MKWGLYEGLQRVCKFVWHIAFELVEIGKIFALLR